MAHCLAVANAQGEIRGTFSRVDRGETAHVSKYSYIFKNVQAI